VYCPVQHHSAPITVLEYAIIVTDVSDMLDKQSYQINNNDSKLLDLLHSMVIMYYMLCAINMVSNVVVKYFAGDARSHSKA